MEFLFTSPTFPFSAAVIHSGRTLETVLTGIPRGDSKPVGGGVAAELREIFRQLDEVLAAAGASKTSVVSVRLYLQDVVRDIVVVNEIYREYFGKHPPNRRAYGVNLRRAERDHFGRGLRAYPERTAGCGPRGWASRWIAGCSARSNGKRRLPGRRWWRRTRATPLSGRAGEWRR